MHGEYLIGLNEVKNGLPLPSCFCAIARNGIAPNWFNRAYLHAELYSPEEAIPPGFLDEVVASEALRQVSFDQAKRLGELPSPAYAVAKEFDRKPFTERVMQNFHADALQAFAATLPDTSREGSPAA
jgi:enoyl-CoA hydratase